MAKTEAKQNPAESEPNPTPHKDEDGTIDSDARFIGMIEDHVKMGTATPEELALWKKRLGK